MSRHLAAPYWGVRAHAELGWDIAARAAFFAERMPQRAFYFGRTAAALHRLPLPARFSMETALHVAVPAGERRIDALQITAHHVRVGPDDVIDWRQTSVSSAPRTWCDLAPCLTLGELVAVGDRLIWHRSPLTSVAQLATQIERYEGRRGIRAMRSAIGLLSNAADSAPESELRVAIVQAGFPPPRVNEQARLSSGGSLHPDLSWPESRVAIEYEGDHHRTDRDQWRTDIRRLTELHDDGWSTYRATGDDYRMPHRLLAWLGRHLPPTR